MDEYIRRIDLCFNAVEKATQKLKLDHQTAEDYQGAEVFVKTDTGRAKVIILMDTGHGPRFPKYITLSVHGCLEHKFNGKVSIFGGGYGGSEQKFLPNKISVKWLQEAILKSSEALQSICSTKNMEEIKKIALAKRRQVIKETPYMRHEASHFNLNKLR